MDDTQKINEAAIKLLTELIEKLQSGDAQVSQISEDLGIVEDFIDGHHFMAHDGNNTLRLEWTDMQQQKTWREKLRDSLAT